MNISNAHQLLAETQTQVVSLGKRNEELHDQVRSLHMKVTRASKQKENTVRRVKEVRDKRQRVFAVKEKGVVTVNARNAIQDLIKLRVEPRNVHEVMKAVLVNAGMEMSHPITDRTASRVCIEGGVIADMQITSAVQSSTSEFYAK